MKTLNAFAKAMMGGALVLTLAACGKTSTSSTTASVPVNAGSCQLVGTGYYYLGTNTPCTPGVGGTTTICPSNGQYTTQYGTIAYCTPGQSVNMTYYPPNGYPYNSNPMMTGGCDSYYYIYGVLYIPMYMQGQLVCVNSQYLTNYFGNNQNSYQYGYYSNPYSYVDYYYAYPPYTGSGCGTSIYFGSDYGNLGVCF